MRQNNIKPPSRPTLVDSDHYLLYGAMPLLISILCFGCNANDSESYAIKGGGHLKSTPQLPPHICIDEETYWVLFEALIRSSQNPKNKVGSSTSEPNQDKRQTLTHTDAFCVTRSLLLNSWDISNPRGNAPSWDPATKPLNGNERSLVASLMEASKGKALGGYEVLISSIFRSTWSQELPLTRSLRLLDVCMIIEHGTALSLQKNHDEGMLAFSGIGYYDDRLHAALLIDVLLRGAARYVDEFRPNGFGLVNKVGGLFGRYCNVDGVRGHQGVSDQLARFAGYWEREWVPVFLISLIEKSGLRDDNCRHYLESIATPGAPIHTRFYAERTLRRF
jgi:hypothetical protein